VAGSVQLASQGAIVRTHAIRHGRAKEHGAYATPHGCPQAATECAGRVRRQGHAAARSARGPSLDPRPLTGANRSDAGHDLAATTGPVAL
jgi:hypothetical protein